MPTIDEAIILLGLRLLAAVSLLGFWGLLAWYLRRDVQLASQAEQDRRSRPGRLVVVANPHPSLSPGTRLPLLPDTTIGRAAHSTVQVMDSTASHHHARVVQRMGQWWLEDRQSSNGTRLNGDLISEPIVLSSGDIITIGALEMRLELDDIP